MRRRTYLATATATATALTIAGCMGGGEDEDEEETPDAQEEDESADHDGEDADGDEGERGDTHTDAPEMAGIYEDFADIEEWDELVGSLTTDTSRTNGSQSALLSVSEGVEQGRIRLELDEAIDCTEVLPGMTMATDGSGSSAPYLQLHDGALDSLGGDSGGGMTEFRGQIYEEGGLQSTAFGIDGSNDIDYGEVTELQIVHWLGEETDGRLWIDDVHFTPRPQQAKVMIHLVGGYESHYLEALPLIEEYDLPVTAFITPGRLRRYDDADGDRLTFDQLEELDDADWTIASNGAHGLDLTSLPERDPEDEVALAREWLEDNGFEDGAPYFAYPSGRYDEDVVEIVQDNHELAFTAGFPCHGYAANPHTVPAVSGPTAEAAEQMLDMTAEMNGITSLAYYALDDAREDFRDTLAYISTLESEGEIDVITPHEMEEYVFEL